MSDSSGPGFDDESARTVVLAIGGVFLLMGAGVLLMTGWLMAGHVGDVVDTVGAEKTEGTVLSSQVESETRTCRRGGRPGQLCTTYRANITYQYTVDRRSYRSDSVWAGYDVSPSAERAQELVRDHPEGATVVVHYDGAEPSQTWLVSEIPLEGFLAGGVGLVIGGVAAGLGYLLVSRGLDSE
jgi:hypothetical protein